MKTHFILATVVPYVCFGLVEQKQQTHKLYAHSISADMSHGDTIQGDFNGDGKPEYLWVDSGRYRETMKCKDKQCKIKACCSNKNIPALVTNRDYDTGIYGMRAI